MTLIERLVTVLISRRISLLRPVFATLTAGALPCSVLLACGLAAGPVSAGHPLDDRLIRAFAVHCIECHGRNGSAADEADLSAAATTGQLPKEPEFLQTLIEVLDDRRMPPEGETPLEDPMRQHLVDRLRDALANTIGAREIAPRSPLRRMTRFHYSNAVKDLFDLNVEVFSLPERILREYGNYFQPDRGKLPAEVRVGSRSLGKSQMIEPRLIGVAPFPQDLRAEHGFDNQADHLTLSPLLLESFVRLSHSILNSPNFTERTCGIWGEMFAEPKRAGSSVQKAVRKRLRNFLTLAFRGVPEPDQLDRYVSHVMELISAGTSFPQAMKSAAAAAIASPRFIYLYDVAPNDSPSAGDLALASRLSFFLWGSIPDQRLLRLALKGKLHHPDVLAAETKRMLNDERLKRFCDSFPAQWLQLDRIVSSTPDPQQFPQFYFAKYRASMHMVLEPLLLFEATLVEDLPITTFIDSDFSYRSDLLQAWYRNGSAGRVGPPTILTFKRVSVDDRREGGMITNAAVMTMTSSATRTLPITRGAWVAGVILNDPPEPPPANVPPLADEPDDDQAHLTLRERFEAHRKQPACAGCHREIDPLGFALENYNAAGIWRDRYANGLKIDPSGSLFGKQEFSSVIEFKDAILTQKDRFARAFASHLLSFALARPISVEDSLEVDEIVAAAAKENYRFQALIGAVVQSKLFNPPAHPGEANDLAKSSTVE